MWQVIVTQVLMLVIVAVIIGIAIYYKGVADERRESYTIRERGSWPASHAAIPNEENGRVNRDSERANKNQY